MLRCRIPRAARCALSHTHIAPRKIVLTTPFFSLVLDVTICSPSLLLYAFVYHSALLPGVISHRNLHLVHHFFFGYFRCLYVYGHPPPIVSSSLHAAQRHLSSNHTDFGKSPSLDFYSLPWIGALLSFYFVSRHFSFLSFLHVSMRLPAQDSFCRLRPVGARYAVLSHLRHIAPFAV